MTEYGVIWFISFQESSLIDHVLSVFSEYFSYSFLNTDSKNLRVDKSSRDLEFKSSHE